MWPSLIKDLLDNGWTQARLAVRIGVAQTTISEMANGRIKEPGWSKGQALLALHTQLGGNNKNAPGKEDSVCDGTDVRDAAR